MTIDINRCLRIPTLPTVAVEVLRLFDDPDCSMEQVTAIVRKDPAITAKLLKTANSVQYGSRGNVTDLKRAVTMLGRNAVTPLVLSFSLANQSLSTGEQTGHFKKFWLRSFVQATAAEILAAMFGSPSFKGEAYSTNLLAGVGKLALLRGEPEKYTAVLEQHASTGIPLLKAEQDDLGITHIKLAAELLTQIGLPQRCVNAILSLDRNAESAGQMSSEETLLTGVTRAANAIASLLCGNTQAVSIVELEEALEDLNLPTEQTSEDILPLVQDRIDATASLFDVDVSQLPSVADLLQDALEQLARFSAMATHPDAAEDVPEELLQENGRLKRRVADLLRQSRADILTGAFNRAFFLQVLAERTALHRVRAQMLGLAVIDIDHFKKVNDTYGHLAGDHVLKAVADGVRAVLRDADMLARYGGEEFVILMDDANIEGLSTVGERIRSAVEKLQVSFDGVSIPVTVSVGLTAAFVRGDEADFARNLFAMADMAMYQAKHGGRNRIVVDSMDRLPQEVADPNKTVPRRPSAAMTR